MEKNLTRRAGFGRSVAGWEELLRVPAGLRACRIQLCQAIRPGAGAGPSRLSAQAAGAAFPRGKATAVRWDSTNGTSWGALGCGVFFV